MTKGLSKCHWTGIDLAARSELAYACAAVKRWLPRDGLLVFAPRVTRLTFANARASQLESSPSVNNNEPRHTSHEPAPIGVVRMNPLETLQGTVIAGVVLAVVLAFVAKAIVGV